MPYVLISAQTNLSTGPTVCGDERADAWVMEYLGAMLEFKKRNDFGEYTSLDPPCVVLNKMDRIGYRVVASTGVGQTIIWTLYKPDEKDAK